MACGRKWGPFCCILASLCLCMADLTRHLVNDSWGTDCSELSDGQSLEIVENGIPQILPGKFTKYCFSRNVANEYKDDGSLSAFGWIFSVFCTWAGFVLLFVGICWAINLPGKVKSQWRQIRNSRAARGPLLDTA